MFYLVILIVAAVICVATFVLEEGQFAGVLVAGIAVLTPFFSYLNHADNLGTIRAQKSVIQVYEQRAQELNAQLKMMIPEGRQMNPLLLNADSPVKGIIESVSKANADLAAARVAVAESRVSISKRKAGPLSFIVKWYGED